MAEYKDEHVISNELQLINKETVLGHKNIDINKNFEFYRTYALLFIDSLW